MYEHYKNVLKYFVLHFHHLLILKLMVDQQRERQQELARLGHLLLRGSHERLRHAGERRDLTHFRSQNTKDKM